MVCDMNINFTSNLHALTPAHISLLSENEEVSSASLCGLIDMAV